ncbi:MULTISPECIES: hypothetical protein [Ramlibacter]|uniref:Uncharacterized protein n=1 Tax=Ramlibacter pinisoli TaxID=2682844 RepID=A0A6N8IXU4_9BURK|nr:MULTISPECIES: hypothetical protein [Ramlibacter]MBA2960914.1 hypothetical protein [Ramlibacter sp. CGMCC 1.13660]MVQ30860.1 hypothetical protein [Ramlibacter pinisoli]
MQTRSSVLSLAFPIVGVLAAGSAAAQGAAWADPGPWRTSISLYGYLPSVSGSSNFPQPGGGSDVGVRAKELLQNVQSMFMGSLEVNRGRWGVFTDFAYFDLGDETSGTRDLFIGGNRLPADASASVDFSVKGSLWTTAASYRFLSYSDWTLDVFGGFRRIDVEQRVSWQLGGNVGQFPLPARGGNLSSGTTNWDPVVGVKGRIVLGTGRTWFVPYYFDIGAGQSRYTWQASAGLGYAFAWGDLVGSWRRVDYEFQPDQPIGSLRLDGPAIAAVWHW